MSSPQEQDSSMTMILGGGMINGGFATYALYYVSGALSVATQCCTYPLRFSPVQTLNLWVGEFLDSTPFSFT